MIDNAIKHGYKKTKILVKLYSYEENIFIEVINNGDEISIIMDRLVLFVGIL